MSWSRTPTATAQTAAQPAGQSPATAQQGTTSSTTNSSTSGSSSSSTSGQKSTQNMTPEALASLQVLIGTLMAGGTPEQRAESANRTYEINAARALREGYSKEAAFADAKGAQAAQLRASLEQLLPSITRASEGSGASQSAMRALLLQDAQQRAADSAATLGLQAATQYGGIAANVTGILEALTRPQNAVTNALLQALQISKGAVENSSWSENTSGSSSSNTTSTTQGSTSQSGTSQSSLGPSRVEQTQGPVFIAPLAGQGSLVETAKSIPNNQWTAETAAALTGLGQRSGWSNYTF